MKLKLTNCKIKRYEYGEYYVDIFDTVENGEAIFEATLTKKGYGRNHYIVGMPKHQVDGDISLADFLDMVENGLPEDIDIYEAELANEN